MKSYLLALQGSTCSCTSLTAFSLQGPASYRCVNKFLGFFSFYLSLENKPLKEIKRIFSKAKRDLKSSVLNDIEKNQTVLGHMKCSSGRSSALSAKLSSAFIQQLACWISEILVQDVESFAAISWERILPALTKQPCSAKLCSWSGSTPLYKAIT